MNISRGLVMSPLALVAAACCLMIGYATQSFATYGSDECITANTTAELQLELSGNGSASPGDTICLTSATYSLGGQDPDNSFDVKVNKLTIKGNGKSNTVLDGAQVARHVLLVDDENVQQLTVRNVSIINGFSDLDSPDGGFTDIGQGAGIYINGADVRLKGVRIAHNKLIDPTPTPPINTEGPPYVSLDYPGGAGIFARGSNLVIIGSVIEHNTASNNAGIMMVGQEYPTTAFLPVDLAQLMSTQSSNGSLIMKNTQVKNNAAQLEAGAGRLTFLNSVEIHKSDITNNVAGDPNDGFDFVGSSAGLLLTHVLDINVHRTVFLDNTAEGARAAMTANYFKKAVISKSKFKKNHANLGVTALAITAGLQANNPSELSIHDTTISNNTGEARVGLTLTHEQYSNPPNFDPNEENTNTMTIDIDNVHISGNEAAAEAAMAMTALNFLPAPELMVATIKNSVFIDNTAFFDPIVVINSATANFDRMLYYNNSSGFSGIAYIIGVGSINNAIFFKNTHPGALIGVVFNSHLESIKNSAIINNTIGENAGFPPPRNAGVIVGDDVRFLRDVFGLPFSKLGKVENVLFHSNDAAEGFATAIHCDQSVINSDPAEPPIDPSTELTEVGPLVNTILLGSDQTISVYDPITNPDGCLIVNN